MFTTHPLELKAADLSADGRFSGYGSTFGGAPDLGGDVVAPFAFKEIVRNANQKIAILWAHSSRDIIGEAAVSQDAKGLAVDGRLLLDDPLARKAYRFMKAGMISGLSIGFDVLAGGAKMLNNGVRELTALKLYEISVVLFPMQPLAQIESVKSFADCADPHELKHLLHHEHGFTRTRASLAAADLWKHLHGEIPKAERRADLLNDFFQSLKGN